MPRCHVWFVWFQFPRVYRNSSWGWSIGQFASTFGSKREGFATLLIAELRRSSVEVGSFSPIIYKVLYIPGGWPWDFWTINSSMTFSLRFLLSWKVRISSQSFGRKHGSNWKFTILQHVFIRFWRLSCFNQLLYDGVPKTPGKPIR